jgi:hypothetical protein
MVEACVGWNMSFLMPILKGDLAGINWGLKSDGLQVDSGKELIKLEHSHWIV